MTIKEATLKVLEDNIGSFTYLEVLKMIDEKNFDNNRLPRSTYEAVSWVGLGEIENNQATVAWDNLSSTEKQAIETLITQNFFNGPSNCN